MLRLAFSSVPIPHIKNKNFRLLLFVPFFIFAIFTHTTPHPITKPPHVGIPSDTCNIITFARRTIDSDSFLSNSLFFSFPPYTHFFVGFPLKSKKKNKKIDSLTHIDATYVFHSFSFVVVCDPPLIVCKNKADSIQRDSDSMSNSLNSSFFPNALTLSDGSPDQTGHVMTPSAVDLARGTAVMKNSMRTLNGRNHHGAKNAVLRRLAW